MKSAEEIAREALRGVPQPAVVGQLAAAIREYGAEIAARQREACILAVTASDDGSCKRAVERARTHVRITALVDMP